jgi:hypothetical protein
MLSQGVTFFYKNLTDFPVLYISALTNRISNCGTCKQMHTKSLESFECLYVHSWLSYWSCAYLIGQGRLHCKNIWTCTVYSSRLLSSCGTVTNTTRVPCKDSFTFSLSQVQGLYATRLVTFVCGTFPEPGMSKIIQYSYWVPYINSTKFKNFYIVACRSIVWTGDSATAVARDRLCGHVSPATREYAIMVETFSVRSVPRLYNED